MTDKERKELIKKTSKAVSNKYKRTFESLQSQVEETEPELAKIALRASLGMVFEYELQDYFVEVTVKDSKGDTVYNVSSEVEAYSGVEALIKVAERGKVHVKTPEDHENYLKACAELLKQLEEKEKQQKDDKNT